MMTDNTTTKPDVMGFQAEVSQLLYLVTHALYSNKEIFLRELISNASDAEDKLRFCAISNDSLYEGQTDLSITIDIDKENKCITISDNGIGMNRDDVIQNLGTIAKSGTREFIQALTGEQAKDSQLIGQFGVGFYSAFIVSDKVTVKTRKAGDKPEHGVIWVSDGQSNYTIEACHKADRGTEITLHLKEDSQEFLDEYRVKSIIRKYSDHIPFPINMLKTSEDEKETAIEYETINKATALWTLPKSKVTDEEYREFYKHISHDYDDPLMWSHNKVEGKLDYTSLLYIPSHAPFDLWHREHARGLKLYVKRVFIMDDAEELLPLYLRFVKGVIDSADLPLNVSREILQNNKTIAAIRQATAKRVLDMLSKIAQDEPEKYQKFWDQFGLVIKEGPAEDFANKEKIAELLRFATTHSHDAVQSVSFDQYLSRMKEGQDKIYYITAESYAAAKNSPHLEIFKEKNIEVLLLSDRVDEWLVANLHEYQGKTLQSVAKGKLDLGELADEAEKQAQESIEKDFSPLVEKVKATLEGKVKDVVITHRLKDSPACVVSEEHELSANIQRILKASGQEVPTTLPVLELNPKHPMVINLNHRDEESFKRWCLILLDQAILAEGGKLDNPAEFIQSVNQLLAQV
jgi:molecular chaperone HtpG